MYWKNSTRLAPIVSKWICGKPLDNEEQAIFANYLLLWLENFPSSPELEKFRDSWQRKVLHGDRQSIEEWLEALNEIGIDPL